MSGGPRVLQDEEWPKVGRHLDIRKKHRRDISTYQDRNMFEELQQDENNTGCYEHEETKVQGTETGPGHVEDHISIEIARKEIVVMGQ